MNVWELPEFETGIVLGAAAAVIVVAAYVVARVFGHRSPLPVCGLAFVLAGLFSVDQTYPVTGTVAIGIAGVAGAAWLADVPWVPTWATVAFVAPFGWAIGFAGIDTDTAWIQVAGAITASLGAVLVAATDARWASAAPAPALVAITDARGYLTVPDTEEAVALLGAVVPLALVGWPIGAARLGRAGAAASTALLVWVVAFDGRGRPSSIVGSLACLGLLLGLPVGRALLPRAARPLKRSSRTTVIVLVVAAHAGIVAVAARVAGFRDELSEAVAIAVAVGVASVVVGSFLPPKERTVLS
ncbi:MAG: hypothetical protein WKF43_00210 [Acidimicrobiales bacterium]